MRVRSLFLTAISGLLLAMPIASWSQHHHDHDHEHMQEAQDNIQLVVNLTKDKAPSAVMAMRFASISLGRGNPTVIWLNSEGVRLADAKAKPTEAKKMLEEFIAKGGKVYVCPHCAKMFGVKELIKGAEFGNPDIIFGLLSEDRVRIISW
ncbi:MAG: DsrE family protein [Aquificaceae bacterium]